MYTLKLLSDEEKMHISKGAVKSTGTSENMEGDSCLESSSIFGSSSKVGPVERKSDIRIARDRDFRLGHIVLPARVPNFALLGRNFASQFSKYILPLVNENISGNKLSELVEVISKKEYEEFIEILDKQGIGFIKSINLKLNTYSVSDVSNEPAASYYFGAEALLKLLECSLTMNDQIIREKIKKDFSREAIEFTNEKDQFHVVGKYGILLKPGESRAVLHEKWQEKVAKKDSSYIFLMNLRPYADFEKLFPKTILVLPLNMRPKFEGRNNPLTILYRRIVAKAKDMYMSTNKDTTVGEYKIRLKELYIVTRSLLDEYEGLSTIEKAKEAHYSNLTLLKRIASKEGHIRGRMLSKRKDFSGRSAITVNPTLRLDQTGLPKEMLKELYLPYLLRDCKLPYEIIKDMTPDEVATSLKEHGVLDRVPAILNRAPTLHKLSYLSFYVVPTDQRSIELNPLVCAGYNADFDGDQMAVHVPIGEKAVQEARELMLSSRNIFVPASGSHTTLPRHEMIFGLNVATKKHVNKNSKTVPHKTLAEIYTGVMNHSIKVYDRVAGYQQQAGTLAVLYGVPEDLRKDVNFVIDKNTIKKLADMVIPYGEDAFIRTMSHLTLLGFKIAELYAPDTSILHIDENNETLKKPFREFRENMRKIRERYALGFEDEDSFSKKFHEEFSKADATIAKAISDVLGEDNGYLQLVNAGARGSTSNLVQIYSHKGLIKKGAGESFRVAIEDSYSTQLTPLAHFVNAYASRLGVMDRSQKTADTGYANRKMYQAASDVVIRKHDCRADVGLPIRRKSISSKVFAGESEKEAETSKVMESIIIGRYLVDKKDDFTGYENIYHKLIADRMFVSPELAKEIALSEIPTVHLRSPLTCREQCCAKCYGTDLSTRKPAIVGTPVGLIAGQSIGEPGTQLTMRTFQSGGVAGKSSVTSDFDRMQMFIDNRDIKNKGTYDPIAWSSGKVITVKNEGKLRVSIEGSKKYITLPGSAVLKAEVTQGEGLCVIEGDHNVDELLAYSNEEIAKEYIALAMYLTYYGKVDVNFKHFEVLLSEMFRYFVVQSSNNLIREALAYSYREVMQSSKVVNGKLVPDKVKIYPVFYGARSSNIRKSSALSSILMEQVKSGLFYSTMAGSLDGEETVMSSILMGDKPKIATEINTKYIEERRSQWQA